MIAVLIVSSAVAGENRIRPYRDVLHAALRPVPGFALDDCNLLHGDQLDRIVSWKANTDVSRSCCPRLRAEQQRSSTLPLDQTDGPVDHHSKLE